MSIKKKTSYTMITDIAQMTRPTRTGFTLSPRGAMYDTVLDDEKMQMIHTLYSQLLYQQYEEDTKGNSKI